MRTSNKRVTAAGDVTSLPRFTHTAGVNGSNAATNAVLGLRRRTDSVVPRVTFTDPELAAVGVQEDADAPHHVLTVRHRDLDRAIAERDTAGFTRLVLDTSGIVIGGTIVGPRAGESLAEVTLAVRNRLKAADIAGTTHPYPTYNDGVWNAALIDVRRRLRRRRRASVDPRPPRRASVVHAIAQQEQRSTAGRLVDAEPDGSDVSAKSQSSSPGRKDSAARSEPGVSDACP